MGRANQKYQKIIKDPCSTGGKSVPPGGNLQPGSGWLRWSHPASAGQSQGRQGASWSKRDAGWLIVGTGYMGRYTWKILKIFQKLMGKIWESADALMNHRIYWGVAQFKTGQYIRAFRERKGQVWPSRLSHQDGRRLENGWQMVSLDSIDSSMQYNSTSRYVS